MKRKYVKSSEFVYKLWLALILGVPIAALIVFSSVLVSGKVDVLLEMNEIDTASHLINRSSDLVHELQKERGYTSGFIASPKDNFEIELIGQRAATDEQYALFLKKFSSIKQNEMRATAIDIFDPFHFVHHHQRHHVINAAIINNLDLALVELDKLKDIRVDVDSHKIGYFDALEYYSKTNSLILDTIAFVSQLGTDREISTHYRAYYHLQMMKEKAGLQRATLTYAFESGKFLPGQYEKFLAVAVDESYSHKRFLSLAPPDIKETYLKTAAMPEVAQADWMKQIAVEKGVGGHFRIDAAYWNKMQTAKIDRIEAVCDLLEERAKEVVDARRAEAKNSLIIYLLVNLAVITFALLMAVLLFRNIAKRREAEKRMESALHRAKDVLNAIATSPDIIPFFTVSPIYRSMLSVGGGDIVKWARFRSRYAGLYLHDVAGHSIEEILLNILGTALVDVCKTNPAKKSASAPSVFLSCLNEHLEAYCEGTPDYLTAIYLLMDFEEREIRLATGGHPRPWLINPDGTVRRVEAPTGFILGQFTIDPLADDRYRDIAFRLETGQLLLVSSDGLMEQKDAGGTTLEAKFQKDIGRKLAGLEPRAAYGIIKREFEAHLDGRTPEDDVSFVLVGTRPANKYETMRFIPGPELLSLICRHKSVRDGDPASPPKQCAAKSSSRSAGKADDVIMHTLSDSYGPVIEKLKNAQWPDGRISQVELAVSEMIINAIMHGNMCSNQSTVELSYALHDGELEVSVADEGAGFDSNTLPQSIEENMLMEGGRGLHMISAVADSLYFNDAGNRCWALFKKNA
ncbi:MAG: nitrate- and nitrite sensing domain-containing protein [Nitrospinae bacterium]|nr:nitrate- and nitrite sensing domain-containing protein [Nitrospinota bacterium]